MLAFGLNGTIALLTALSFAELAAAFPLSGGTYTFAKKVLTVEAAFVVGWVVWFASVVAAVLYALGFASYAVLAVETLWQATAGAAPTWISSRVMAVTMALAATGFYAVQLCRRSAGGGQWATVGKLIVFICLILGGVWALSRSPSSVVRTGMSPFFAGGAGGLFAAMGYTFIALQGFDLIAAVGGEVKDPGRTIPRAMLISLSAALLIYLPFLFIVATVGTGAGESIVEMSAASPATVVAIAAANYLGPFGYWLVIVAALLSMLSALQANLFAASRISFAMARDRTLPASLSRLRADSRTPTRAVVATTLLVLFILLVIPDVAAAGAASSLVFLISFALAHWTNVLMRRRRGDLPMPFKVPFFPLVPAFGGAACIALAVFQAMAVPAAGGIALFWLCIGWIGYIFLFARRARVLDAHAEATDPELVRLRGRTPIVLVPIANPANAPALVGIASALAPQKVGRVLLLSIVQPPEVWDPDRPPPQLVATQEVLGAALTASFAAALAPEAITIIANDPWHEIDRLARAYQCESLLLGLSVVTTDASHTELERLLPRVDANVIVLKAPPGWDPRSVQRALVPVRGRGDQSLLRARLLGSLGRGRDLEVTYLGILSAGSSETELERARQDLLLLAQDEGPGTHDVQVVASADVAGEITSRVGERDLVVMGTRRLGRRQKLFGETPLRVAQECAGGVLLISRRG
jgi:amino acid transporter/nucleotide-binding universal stress UspA family protein